jgi:tRNA pseudouridine55 synthase
VNGLLVVDKPGGMTSQDVLYRMKKWLPRGTKVGHTGTLDPLATGVLVVCLGNATRLADIVQCMGKSYTSRFRLGAISDTDDADGTVTPTPDAEPPSKSQVREALARFVGVIEQVPPAYSALKVGGRRAHDLARSGTAMSLAPRPVRIDAVRLVRYEWPFVDVEVDCGKGTYIRCIARDAGAALGVGGMVETLRRTRIGPFTAEQGIGLDATPADVHPRVLPASAAVAGMPRATIDAATATRFRCGVSIAPVTSDAAAMGQHMGVFDTSGDFVGLGEQLPDGLVRPAIILDRWK